MALAWERNLRRLAAIYNLDLGSANSRERVINAKTPAYRHPHFQFQLMIEAMRFLSGDLYDAEMRDDCVS
jgi:hypothetical protein